MESNTERVPGNGSPAREDRASASATPALLRVAVTCNGITPMLHNRILPDVLENIRIKTKKPKTAPPPRTPREEATPKVHTDFEGWPIIPTEMLFSCLVGAGRSVRLEGRKMVSTARETRLPAFMTIEDPYIRIINPENPSEKPAWEVDMRAGRNPNGGELVCIVRPRFDIWSFTANIVITQDSINPYKIRELFDIAGRQQGLGDFRPEKKGYFGQFTVNCWKTTMEHLSKGDVDYTAVM